MIETLFLGCHWIVKYCIWKVHGNLPKSKAMSCTKSSKPRVQNSFNSSSYNRRENIQVVICTHNSIKAPVHKNIISNGMVYKEYKVSGTLIISNYQAPSSNQETYTCSDMSQEVLKVV